MKSSALVSRILHLLFIPISLCMLLTFISCECEDSSSQPAQTKPVSEYVNSELNIDTNDATDVNIAIGTRRLIGDDDTADALIMISIIKCDEYRDMAEDAEKDGDYKKAVEYYEEALKWAKDVSRLSGNEETKGVIYSAMARCMLLEALEYKHESMKFDSQESYHKAADYYVEAAKRSPSVAGYYYFWAAECYNQASLRRECCNYLSEASDLLSLQDDSLFHLAKDKIRENCASEAK